MDTNLETVSVKKTGEEKLARFISYLFHPLLMPTYGFIILFFTDNYISVFTSLRLRLVILIITFVFTFLFPFVNALILLKMGRIKSLSMEDTTERYIPYATTILYYFALYYLFYNVGAAIPSFFMMLVLGATLSVLLTFIINFKWKISAHTIGIGGIAGATLGTVYRLQMELYLILMLIIIVAGIVGYARLKLKAHTPAQIYMGFLLGFLVEFLVILFYR
jgi:membrane-associated phospholipid phosphatase